MSGKKHQIKTLGGAVLFEAEIPEDTPSGLATRVALEQARAYLRGAYLRGAYLGGAYLGGAYLGGKKLVGDRPVLQIGSIGSREDYLLAFLTDQGVVIKAGCFEGSIEEFLEQPEKTHGTNEHAREYGAALALIHVHAELWTPAPDAAEPAKTEQEAA